MPEYPLLFSPLAVGPIVLKNRIVNAAHATGFAKDGGFTEQLIEYHRTRSRGGAALLVSQATSVSRDYGDLKNVDSTIVPDYQAVSAAARESGAHYSAELYHPGSQGEYSGTGAETHVAPTAQGSTHTGERWRVPHALAEAEILEIVEMFAAAARRCREGLLSGIELHFAHGNLVEQFISPKTNHRTDDWGGALENRLRFAELIARAVRDAAGPGLAVGARVSAAGLGGDEPSQMDMVEAIGTMGTWGCFDYMSLTRGHYADAWSSAQNIPNMTFPTGLLQKYGRQVKNVLDVPVFMVGRINHPRTAEDLLESQSCDAVVMARALIADPYFPEKARTGRSLDIRPCVGAMNCTDSLGRGRGIRCIHNPRVGRELTVPEDVDQGSVSRSILVVGGGPAGLESARVAAHRGHHVTLIERASRLGGQALTASQTPGRGELLGIVEWLEQQTRQAGVQIRVGEPATSQTIAAAQYDAVILATGAIHPVPPAHLHSSATTQDSGETPVKIVGLDEALTGDIPVGRIVIYDSLADWPGFNLARRLIERGCDVRYLTPELYPGAALEITNWRLEYQALSERGVRFSPITEVVGTSLKGVIVRRDFRRSTETLHDVETLVWISSPLPDSAMLADLSDSATATIVVGDAYSPRGIEQAILHARLAVSTL